MCWVEALHIAPMSLIPRLAACLCKHRQDHIAGSQGKGDRMKYTAYRCCFDLNECPRFVWEEAATFASCVLTFSKKHKYRFSPSRVPSRLRRSSCSLCVQVNSNFFHRKSTSCFMCFFVVVYTYGLSYRVHFR
jgi:hypothetical protein